MQQKNLVLQEEDCATDARQYFNTSLKKLLGFTVNDFKDISKIKYVDDLGTQWKYKNYILEFNEADPYYRLYELKEKQNEI